MGALIHVTAWERKSLWRRIPAAFVRVAILIAILDALASYVGPPLMFFIIPRWEARKLPHINLTPKPLRDYTVSDAPATLVSVSGYQFEVPGKPTEKKRNEAGGILLLELESRKTILVFAKAGDGAGLLTELANDKSMSLGNWLRPVLGELLNRSPYEQYAAILNATPSSIHPFGSRRDAIGGIELLMVKGIAPTSGIQDGIFSFGLPDRRGFQLGDPQKRPSTELDVFLANDHWVQILFGARVSGPRFTQSELNRVLVSLRAAPTESAQLPECPKTPCSTAPVPVGRRNPSLRRGGAVPSPLSGSGSGR